jgi:hypothetical protein
MLWISVLFWTSIGTFLLGLSFSYFSPVIETYLIHSKNPTCYRNATEFAHIIGYIGLRLIIISLICYLVSFFSLYLSKNEGNFDVFFVVIISFIFVYSLNKRRIPE